MPRAGHRLADATAGVVRLPSVLAHSPGRTSMARRRSASSRAAADGDCRRRRAHDLRSTPTWCGRRLRRAIVNAGRISDHAACRSGGRHWSVGPYWYPLTRRQCHGGRPDGGRSRQGAATSCGSRAVSGRRISPISTPCCATRRAVLAACPRRPRPSRAWATRPRPDGLRVAVARGDRPFVDHRRAPNSRAVGSSLWDQRRQGQTIEHAVGSPWTATAPRTGPGDFRQPDHPGKGLDLARCHQPDSRARHRRARCRRRHGRISRRLSRPSRRAAQARRPDWQGAARFSAGARTCRAHGKGRLTAVQPPRAARAFGNVVLEAKVSSVASVVTPSGDLPRLAIVRTVGSVGNHRRGDCRKAAFFLSDPDRLARRAAALASADRYSGDRFARSWRACSPAKKRYAMSTSRAPAPAPPSSSAATSPTIGWGARIFKSCGCREAGVHHDRLFVLPWRSRSTGSDDARHLLQGVDRP